jgi:hypothetical protein
MKKNYIFIAIVFLTFFGITAQEKKAGPIIADYGKVWEINNQDYKIEKNQELKVVFDIMNSPKDTSALNRSIETAARFLNMHAQSGVALENMKVALVVHKRLLRILALMRHIKINTE